MGKGDGMIGGVLAGRYELTAHLSEGRFGDFWQAMDLNDKSEVAVKLLKPEMFTDEKALARFERETKLMKEWRHPNLLRVLDHGHAGNGVPWLVTEMREGRPLADEIGDLALDVDQVCHVAAQIARVLAAAHQRNIVHRGLSPEAVMLCEERGDDYRVKVLDFGMAHLTMASGEEQITMVGERLGTPEYMAPEYIEDYVLDARTDLYTLGILIYEMLCGQPPFVGPSRRVFIKQMTETPAPPSELCMEPVPPWLDQMVLALLEKEPDDRPESAMVVAQALSTRSWPPG